MTVKTECGDEVQSVEVLGTYDIDAEVGGEVWEIDEMPDYPLLPTLLVLDTDVHLASHEKDVYRVLVGELDYMCAFVSDLKHYEFPTFASPISEEFIDPNDYLYYDVRFVPDGDVWTTSVGNGGWHI